LFNSVVKKPQRNLRQRMIYFLLTYKCELGHNK
jgi:hypothetical protein